MPWLRTRFCMLLLYVVVAAAAEVHSVWLSNHWVDLGLNTKCYHTHEPATMPYKSPLEHLQSPHTSSTSSADPLQPFSPPHTPTDLHRFPLSTLCIPLLPQDTAKTLIQAPSPPSFLQMYHYVKHGKPGLRRNWPTLMHHPGIPTPAKSTPQ